MIRLELAAWVVPHLSARARKSGLNPSTRRNKTGVGIGLAAPYGLFEIVQLSIGTKTGTKWQDQVTCEHLWFMLG